MERSKQSPLRLVVHYSQIVNPFLDWLVVRGDLAGNPFAELRKEYNCRSTAAIVRALVSKHPNKALEALRPLPRYGSHLGPVMREHVRRMQTLGLRYQEDRLLQFDRFLQLRPGAAKEDFWSLVREYSACAQLAAGKLRRISLGYVLAKALNRAGSFVVTPGRDRHLAQEVRRMRRRPYIYTVEEIQRLLEGARQYSPFRAPLRPLTLYTMIVLGYCAGLRLGEIVGLELKDIDLVEGTIEIRDTKFFKSRRLPLSPSALAALQNYLEARRQSGAPISTDAPVFCHEKGGYNRVTAGMLLRQVIKLAGLSGETGVRPRVHDLRHTMVVHRMTAWYREGINPQSRLPHLASYLGHKDIHSTLVYLTITEELLQRANERFRIAQPDVLKQIQGTL
ncbi:MAG TPA: tyrosine-type recombinase/integrase [Blastocatellia bacterium]|nr:tyrosine-type recombinase/integrase [Blastocatellia bacterium]